MGAEQLPMPGDDEDAELLALAHTLLEVQAQLNACFVRLLAIRQGRGDDAQRHLASLPHPAAS